MGYVDGFLSGYSARGDAGTKSAPLCDRMAAVNRFEVARLVVSYLNEASATLLSQSMSIPMLGSVWEKMACAKQ
jgi:hypothetical protein